MLFHATILENWDAFWELVLPGAGRHTIGHGYYNLLTGEPATNFPDPLDPRDLLVERESDQLPWA